jgi:hypothetical protein
MGSLLFMVVFPTIFYKRWIQSLAPHYLIVEGNGENGHIPFFNNSQIYLATQSFVEGGIPRLHFGIIMSRPYTLNNNGLRYFTDIWDLGRYDFLTWEDAKEKFSLEVHGDFWIKLTKHYGPFSERMLNKQNALLTSQ